MYDKVMFLLFSALSYYIYCGGAIAAAYSVLSPHSPRRKASVVVFCINFVVLSCIAYFELDLIVNWMLFFIVLFIELLLLFPTDKIGVLFLTMLCILCGLSVNLLIRAMLSLALDVPLASFSPFHLFRISSAVLGSILNGLFFRWLSRSRYIKPLQRILSFRRHLKFLLWTMLVLFVSLSLHLLLYLNPDNSILPKLWSLVSCLFIMLGLYWSLCYAARLSYLDHLREQNTTLKQTLAFRQAQEEQLAAASSRDALTGLLNRRMAQQTIARWMEQEPDFALCLIDLDGLKQVNDVRGHSQGDAYILTAAHLLQHACRHDEDALFRYGGDEFIVLFHKMPQACIEKRMESVCQALAQASHDFPMVISYGIALRQPSDTCDTLISRADQQMYQMKQLHKQGKSQKSC